MRVKKQIALLLSGAVLAGSLAGCSRTLIEHQFHDDTQTIIEEIKDIKESNLALSLQKLDNLFMSQGIDLSIIMTHFPMGRPTPGIGEENIGENIMVSKGDIENFLSQPTKENLTAAFAYDTDTNDYESSWTQCAEQMYDALITYLPPESDGWKTLESNLGTGSLLLQLWIASDGYAVSDLSIAQI